MMTVFKSMNSLEQRSILLHKTDDVDDFLRKWNHYIVKHPEKGNEIRLEGFNFCQSYHSSKERMQFVIDIASGKKVKNRIYLKDLPG